MPDKDLYNWRKSNGVCTSCGKEDAREGRSHCQICEERRLKRLAGYRQTGRCTNCGGKKEKGFAKATCRRCAKKHSRYNRRMRAWRTANALCQKCGRDIEYHREGFKECQTCSDEGKIRAKAWRAIQREKQSAAA